MLFEYKGAIICQIVIIHAFAELESLFKIYFYSGCLSEKAQLVRRPLHFLTRPADFEVQAIGEGILRHHESCNTQPVVDYQPMHDRRQPFEHLSLIDVVLAHLSIQPVDQSCLCPSFRLHAFQIQYHLLVLIVGIDELLAVDGVAHDINLNHSTVGIRSNALRGDVNFCKIVNIPREHFNHVVQFSRDKFSLQLSHQARHYQLLAQFRRAFRSRFQVLDVGLAIPAERVRYLLGLFSLLLR